MVNLIDKDTLVAEIDERIKAWNEYYDEMLNVECYELASGAYLRIDELKDFKRFINTLEVKEVDFGMEIYKYIGEHFKVYDDGNQTLQNKDKNALIGRVDAENIAKHFFKLGLKARQG